MAPIITEDVEADLIERAIRAYCTRERQAGHIVQQPSNSSYVEEANGRAYVVLVNINGVLAVYVLKDDGHIEFVREEDWPDVLKAAERGGVDDAQALADLSTRRSW